MSNKCKNLEAYKALFGLEKQAHILGVSPRWKTEMRLYAEKKRRQLLEDCKRQKCDECPFKAVFEVIHSKETV